MSQSTKRTSKTICCEYYDVHVSDSVPDTLSDVLKKLLADCPTTPDLNWQPIPNEDIYRIDSLSYSSFEKSYTGVFKRLRIDQVPKIGYTDIPDTKPMELGEKESVIEESYFKYFESHNVLIRERNRDAGSFQNIAKYLRNKTGYVGIILSYYEKENQVERFRRAHDLRKLEVSGYQAGTSLFDLDKAPPENMDPLEIIEYYTGYRVRIEITKLPGKMSSPLQKGQIQKLIDKFKRNEGATVDLFKVYGDVNNPNEPDFIDFVKNRLTHEEKVGCGSSGPLPSQILSVIDNAYHAHFGHEEAD